MTAIFIIHSSVLVELLIVCTHSRGLPGGSVVKNPPANVGDTRDTGLVPGLGRSLEGGNGNPFQYSCLKNYMDRGAWQAKVHGSQRVLHDSTHAHTHTHTHTAEAPQCPQYLFFLFFLVIEGLRHAASWKGGSR